MLSIRRQNPLLDNLFAHNDGYSAQGSEVRVVLEMGTAGIVTGVATGPFYGKGAQGRLEFYW